VSASLDTKPEQAPTAPVQFAHTGLCIYTGFAHSCILHAIPLTRVMRTDRSLTSRYEMLSLAATLVRYSEVTWHSSRTTMAAKLEDLPKELLANVFQYFRIHATKGDILSWLLCSRCLYDIAIPILYQNISLNPFNMASFVGSIPAFQLDQDKTFLRHVRSLTIFMPAIYTTEISCLAGANDLYKCLRLLISALKMMDALTSFSLVAKRPYYTSGGRQHPVSLNRSRLSRILDALPRTVTDLELDTKTLDLSRWTRKPPLCCQLCTSIRRLLPRLQHLRLRMQFLCPALLSPFYNTPRGAQSTPSDEESTTNYLPLRTVVIWLSPGGYRSDSNTMLCSSRLYQNLWSTKEANTHQLRTTIVTNARQLHLSGSLPNIQRLVILEKLEYSGIMAWVTRDVIADETSVAPIQGLNEQHGISYFDVKHVIRIPCEAWKIERGCPWMEYVGTRDSLLSLVEGEAAWVQAANGSRFPEASHCRKAILDARELPFEDTATFKAHSQLTCSLWQKGTCYLNTGPAKGPYLLGRVVLMNADLISRSKCFFTIQP